MSAPNPSADPQRGTDSISDATGDVAARPRESFDPAHFARLYRLEARSFWFRGRSDLINWALARHFPTAASLLEIGCGTGYVLGRLHAAFPALALSGSELFSEGLRFARQRLPQSVRLHQLDATAMPFHEEFDVIGAFDVLEHIEDDDAVLANAYSALRPGGGLLITVPQHPWLWSDTDAAACHVRRYRRADLLAKLCDAGFVVRRASSFVCLLLPAMLLARLRKRDGADEVEAELSLPAPLNALGYAALRVEAALVRLGLSLPCGGSLLVVAQKPLAIRRISVPPHVSTDSAMSPAAIPFNRPYMTGRELDYIAEAHANGHLSGDGPFTRRCNDWLEKATGARKALLTHSCTAALEMAALLADLTPGDEVIMPSFTFVSTANAFVLRGAVPVFVDIRPDTLNIDEVLIDAAITPRTRAICVVHYAGVGCEMDAINAIAERHGLLVIEDAAQGIMADYKGRPLGSLSHLAALSFHETKNLISGEGGALLINDERFTERAEIIREKGTNRSQFFRGQVDKYTWVDIGSSYLPGEIVAAFLAAQMEEAERITRERLAIWDRYHAAFADHEAQGRLRRPIVPAHCRHNAHMYYLLLPDLDTRTHFIATLKVNGIHPVFHYIPLHSSPAGQRYGRASGALEVTDRVSDCLVRLPLWLAGMDQQRVIDTVGAFFR